MARSQMSVRSKTTGTLLFWKQNEAIEKAKSDEKLIIFANELTASGKRNYSVLTAEDMWNIHKNTAMSKRNTHEVIREGIPCKLYFDIEFKTKFNPECRGDEMVKTFIELVCWALRKEYEIDCSITDVLWLTSSTEEKFSAHLIFQIENYAFKDNSEAGNFFFYLQHLIKNPTNEDDSHTRPSKQQLNSLIIKNDKGKEEIFCDTAVYAKNKNFRIFLSTKFGKNVPLMLSKCNRYGGSMVGEEDWTKKLFLDSLITHFSERSNLQLLKFRNDYKPVPSKHCSRKGDKGKAFDGVR